MKYPNLIPKSVCRTDIRVVIYGEGLSETGSPIVVYDKNIKSNYQDRSYTKLTAEQKIVTLGAKAYIPGDICPKLAVISSGYVEVYSVKRNIYQGTKARNPDGTVNYTLLEIV